MFVAKVFSPPCPDICQMLTNLILGAGIAYCIACYGIVLYSIIASAIEEKSPQEKEKRDKAGERLREIWKKTPFRSKLTIPIFLIIFLVPLFLVLIPLILAFCVVQNYLAARKAAAELRKHVDYIFAWTNPEDLPDNAYRFIDLHTPKLLDLGFEFESVYLMKPTPRDYYGALFINKSGTTVADLIHIDGNGFFGFVSVLESGRAIDTSSVEAMPELLQFAENPSFTAVHVPDQTISTGYQRHQEKIAELQQTTGDRVLTFRPEQVCDVMQYEGRLFSQQLHELGKRDMPPPAVLPQALPFTREYPLFPG